MTAPDPAAPGDDLDDAQADRLVDILCRELPGRLRAALVGASDDPAYVRGLAAVGVGTVLDALIPPIAALLAQARADGAAEERQRIELVMERVWADPMGRWTADQAAAAAAQKTAMFARIARGGS